MTARILMCGEGGSNLELYRAALEDEGFTVQVFEDPEVVTVALTESGADLVLLDLESAGAAADARIRSLLADGAGAVTVVLKTAPSADEALSLKAAGVAEVLVRPFSMTKLARGVTRSLEKTAFATGLDAPLPSSSASGADGASRRDLEEARRRANQADLDRSRLDGLTARVESLKALVRRKDEEIAELREDSKSASEAAKADRAAHEEAVEAQRRARTAAEEESTRLLAELEERSARHSRQLELLNKDDGAVTAGFEERVNGLQTEMQSLRERYQAVLQEKESLLTEMSETRGTSAGLAQAQQDSEARVTDLIARCEDLTRRLETDNRKHENEINALVRERKKLVGEKQQSSSELAASLEEERTLRKQLQLEFEGLKADLPTERRKVHALVEYQRSLTENVLAGILTVDTSGIITLGNELAARFLEVNLSDLLGAHVDQCEAFQALRPLFAEALAGGRAGPVEFDVGSGVSIRAVATKVPFGPRELVLLSVIAPDKIEVPGGGLEDEGPLARLGAAVAGNISEVQDFAVEIRGYLERLYGTTPADSEAREEVNGALRKVGEMIDFLRDIIEQAESYLS